LELKNKRIQKKNREWKLQQDEGKVKKRLSQFFMLQDLNYAQRLGEQARDTAKNYQWSTVNHLLLRSYENIIANSSSYRPRRSTRSRFLEKRI